WLAHEDAQARSYLDRLCIIEPSAKNDPALQPPPPAQPKPAPAPPPPPAEQKPATILPNFALHNPFTKKAPEPAAPVRPATVRAKIDEGEDPFELRRRRPTSSAPEISRAAQLV